MSKVQAKAKLVIEQPSSFSAKAVSFLTFSILALPSSDSISLMLLAMAAELVWYRDPSGIPLLYLPVKRPESRGDQMVLLGVRQSTVRVLKRDVPAHTLVPEKGVVFDLETLTVQHGVMRLFTCWTDEVKTLGDVVGVLDLTSVPLGST